MIELMMKNTGPTYIELFAGSGLLGSAFTSAGARGIGSHELNVVAAQTLKANGHENVCVGDISKITPEGRCDILLAGPPCQGFSTLNRARRGDTRNQLALEPARWAKVLKPHVVVIENVAPFLDSQEWQYLADELAEIGYNVEADILNAIDFGVPQLRRRSFTIATKRGWIEWPKPKGRQKTVAQAWRGLDRLLDVDPLHVERTPSKLAHDRFKHIPAGGDKRDILKAAPELSPPSWRTTFNAATDVWGRLSWDRPSNTIRTACINPSKGRYIHPEHHRVITLREAARLQSIPDSYQLCGTPYQIARQIGNSVPPKLGEVVARQVINLAA